MRHRVANAIDVRLYFDWANDLDTRQQSFNSAPISFEVHEAWFARKIADPNALMLVFETEEATPVGQVRFEKQTDGEVIIGLSVDKPFRGRGLSSQLVVEACAVCHEQWGNVPISAYIKPDNQPSIRAFERAGFDWVGQRSVAGFNAICLVKT